jgi:CMP/dCMP kinase
VNKVNVVTVDGPAGSGKSTVAKILAQKLNFLYIDTGAMYRALTFKALKENIDLNNKQKIIDLSKNTKIELKREGNLLKVYLDSQDVSVEIRTQEVTRNVKLVASIEEIRSDMVKLQRRLGMSKDGSVLEGRDIGTVVFPDAKYKIYLDATVDVRAKRRFKELEEKGVVTSLEEIREDVILRDKSDMTRKIGPLKKADDAILIDTTNLTIDEVVNKLLELVKVSQ